MIELTPFKYSILVSLREQVEKGTGKAIFTTDNGVSINYIVRALKELKEIGIISYSKIIHDREDRRLHILYVYDPKVKKFYTTRPGNKIIIIELEE